jgi:glycosyltransferase involved in cell wall biosynthesis
MPKISIILPTFNGSKYIREAIDSVLTQTFQDWELIVLDDGSTDNTCKIVNHYLTDKRMRFLKNERNLGQNKTLNLGLKLAKGEYIARIDDDDEWIDKDKLKQQVEFLDSHKDYMLVGTSYNVVLDSGITQSTTTLPTEDKLIRSNLLSQNLFGHSTVMFRRDIALSLGGYDESKAVKYMDDWDLWLKLGTKGKLANLDMVSTNYLSKPNGEARANTKWKCVRFRIRAFLKYSRFYTNHIVTILKLLKYILFYKVPKDINL